MSLKKPHLRQLARVMRLRSNFFFLIFYFGIALAGFALSVSAQENYAPLTAEDALPKEVLPDEAEEVPAAPTVEEPSQAAAPTATDESAKTITNFENEPKAEVLPQEQVKDSLYVVRLQGLNKITARTSVIGIAPNQIVHFGNLEILLVKCWKSPPEEKPEAAALLQVWEKRPNELRQQLFLGWMFASSPGVAALEHAVYDLRVLDCLPPPKSQ